jgi:predicted GIY-YIG superfamily endonuclease
MATSRSPESKEEKVDAQLASIRALSSAPLPATITLPAVADVVQSTRAVYVIECERNHAFYGGEVHVKADDNKGKRLAAVWARFRRHRNGTGAEWTKVHGARRLVFINEYADMFDEDKMVLQWMVKHGIENVRGGQWSQVRLPATVVDDLRRTIWHAQRRCLQCGSSSHFVSKCPFGRLRIRNPVDQTCWSRFISHFWKGCTLN